MTSLHDELEKKLEDPNATPMFLPLSFLKAITFDFSPELELGRGGYGVVFKGVLPSGKIVAVKKLFEIHLVDDKTFQKEVSCLKEIKHQHVVQFIGYCAESSWELIDQPSGRSIWAEIPKRLLCFEYVCNKSLDKYISVSTDESSSLEWNMRYEIIKGICRGLNFLHEECRIVHLDLKPENILMDATLMPKIADFGLARIFSNQQSRIITKNSAGSRGYMAPEYIDRGIISMKADIFSLGVIIIEIITGRRDYPYFLLNSPESIATSCQQFTEEVLANWSYKFESAAKYISTEKYNKQVKQCIAIALKCVDPGMEKRPTANDVIQVLNTVDQMEASKELPEMQCMVNSLVLDTNLSKELIVHNITKDMFNIKTSCTVGGVKKSQECLLPMPFWTSSTSSQNHQEAAKESSEPHQASDKASECTDKLLVLNTIASKDGKVVDETKFNESLPPIPSLLESSASNPKYPEGLQAFSEPESAPEIEVIAGSSMLLDVHPLELCFRFEPNKLIACSLNLTNNTDEQVAFGLLKKGKDQTSFLSSLPLFGVVDPGTIYTLVVIMNKHKNLPRERNVDLILQTTTYYGILSNGDKCIEHFQNAKELGRTVHKVTLKVVCALNGETTFENPIPPSTKIISMEANQFHSINTMDANQIEPLIITGSSRYVHIWNYESQKSMGSIEIPNNATAWCVKFIARKGWFLVGSDDGFIHVYNYKKEMEKIKSFKAHDCSYPDVDSLAIHPTQSYVVSACRKEIKLWDWDGWLGWKCMQKFKEHSKDVRAIACNPVDYNSFASVSDDSTIKVWSLDSPKDECTLVGHIEGVNCLHFFTCGDGQQYLITGSNDKTAKIWDVQMRQCVSTLLHRSHVRSVLPHPSLPLLVTGTQGGHVYLWNSTNFRLKRVLHIGGLSLVRGLACLNVSGRVAIAHADGVSVTDIREEEQVC